MQVPFIDLRRQHQAIRSEIQQALEGVVSEAAFILGPAVDRFEQAFAQYIGRKYCVGLNNGTSALHMALTACDIRSGDEVITTPHTWISTSWAISYVGAKPVYVDIDPVTYNINPDLVEKAITRRTKAILPVHLYGQACQMDALCDIAERYGLVLIEDAAQAHGACYAGRRVGSFGKVGCFSFYPGKNLGAFGEAGAIVTDDEQIAERVRRLRDHAQAGRHNHVELGFNTRMEGIQGAILEVKLRYLDRWNATRRRHAQRYRQLLEGLPGLQVPQAPIAEAHVWHLYVVLVSSMSRELFRQRLSEYGIATAVHYPTLVPLQPAYKHLGYVAGAFPVAESVSRRCVSLPMFPELSDQELDRVARVVSEICFEAKN